MLHWCHALCSHVLHAPCMQHTAGSSGVFRIRTRQRTDHPPVSDLLQDRLLQSTSASRDNKIANAIPVSSRSQLNLTNGLFLVCGRKVGGAFLSSERDQDGDPDFADIIPSCLGRRSRSVDHLPSETTTSVSDRRCLYTKAHTRRTAPHLTSRHTIRRRGLTCCTFTCQSQVRGVFQAHDHGPIQILARPTPISTEPSLSNSPTDDCEYHLPSAGKARL
jgi:hypothetical protein